MADDDTTAPASAEEEETPAPAPAAADDSEGTGAEAEAEAEAEAPAPASEEEESGGGDADTTSSGGVALAAPPPLGGGGGGGIASILEQQQDYKKQVNYASTTFMQPKNILDNEHPPDRNQAQDTIRNAFHPSQFVGIRSLPNAMHPSFRDEFNKKLVEDAHLDNQNGPVYATAGAAPRYERPEDVPAATHAMRVGAKGQKPPQATAPDSGAFLRYEYIPSEYDAPKLAERARVHDSTARRLVISEADFVCTSLPPAPKGAGAFHSFEYDLDPYELKKQSSIMHKQASRDARLGGAMYAGCKGESRFEQNKMMRYECIKWLAQDLCRDWPKSFAGVFEDENGALVCAFHAGELNMDPESAAQPESSDEQPPAADAEAAPAPAPSGEGEGEGEADPEGASAETETAGDDPAAPPDGPAADSAADSAGGGVGIMSLAAQPQASSLSGSVRLGHGHTKTLSGDDLIAASPHGDVTTYMNYYSRSESTAQEFALRKDPLRWGIIDPDGTRVSYVLWPPWVHRRREAPPEISHAPGVSLEAPESFKPEAALVSGRVPFGPQSGGGQAIATYVRTRERSFKF